MKVRNGYVSNSSSSSFYILGVKLPEYEELPDSVRLNITEKDFDNIVDGEFSADVVCAEYGMENYYDCNFIGAYPSDMKGSETLDQFKERVLKEINSLGFEFSLADLKWYKDCGRGY